MSMTEETAVNTSANGLSRKFQSGLRLSLINTMVSRLVTFSAGILLARLVSPEQFGLYAIALVIQTLLLTFNDFGTGTALVRHEGDVRPLLPTVWTVSVGGGGLVYLACLFTAPELASGLGSPQAADLIRLLCFTVLLDGFAAVPGALLTRELRQGTRLVADISGLIVNIGLTVLLAVFGAGAWALVFGQVAGTVVVTVLLLILTRQFPVFGIDRSHIREVVKYGGAVVSSSILIVLLQYTPQTITGRLLGPTALGFFYLASNIANWPASIITTTIERVGLATFSRARDSGVNLDRAASEVIKLVAMAVLPIGATLAVLAPQVIEVVYGQRWLPAAAVLTGLAVAAIARVLADLVFNLMLTAGATISSVLVQAAWLITLIPAAVFATVHWQLSGMGWAVAAVAGFVALPVHAWGLRRAGIHVPALIRGLAIPLLVTAVITALLLGISLIVPNPVEALFAGAGVTGVVLAAGFFGSRKTLNAALDSSA